MLAERLPQGRMMKMRFTKMEGCGNDYVYVDCVREHPELAQADEETLKQLAIAVSDRHFGIGSDGLILILPSDVADFRMKMFNSDGSESEMCGNGTRCIGKFVYDKGLTAKNPVRLETLAGIKVLDLHLKNGQVDTVTVDMGEPVLEPAQIPVLCAKNPVIGMEMRAVDREFIATCVSMGNPHAVVFLEEPVADFDLNRYGKAAEVSSLFPKKANIEFINVLGPRELRMRVWERGAGETLACGTGACATVVAAILNGICRREDEVTVHLLGGDLSIRWDKDTGHVFMTGPARFCFDGVWLK